MTDLIAIGDVMLDVSVESSALARGGDVHGEVRVHPGGSAANAAVWAAAEGASVRLHGRIGDDLAGRLVAESLALRGVDAALAVDPATPTGTMLVVREAGERSMVADRGANALLSPDDLPETLEAAAILLSGYILLYHGSEAAALAALERARAEFVAVDAASWPLLARYGVGRFFEVTAGATVLFANEREAETLTGTTGEEAAAMLAERYPMACVKLGAQGALLAQGDLAHHEPASPTEEADPTGAGDAFDGAFLAALARGIAPVEALRMACLAGARSAALPDPWPER